MAEGNRKDPRARVLNMTVRYKSATVDEFIENHSHDISKGGIFIKTRSPFPAGTLLKFEVRIAEDQRLMHGVGRVVWRREQERAEESFPAGMGIKFIKTGEGAAELISQIVAARQGIESSFDAGIRESSLSDRGNDMAAQAGVPPALPSEAAVDALLNDDGEDTAAPRAANEAETQVSSPPKKRAHAPEKRKVVLQGPALDAPPSSKKPAVAVAQAAPEAAAEHAPSRAHPIGQRATNFDETTSPRARASRSGQRSNSPSVYGLIAIVGAVALVGVFIKRNRDAAQEQRAVEPELAAELVKVVPPPAVTAAAEPAPPSIEPGEPAPGENAEGALDEATVAAAPAPNAALNPIAAPAAQPPVTPGSAARGAVTVTPGARSSTYVVAPRPTAVAAAPAPPKVTATAPAPPSGSAGSAAPTAAAAATAQGSTEKPPVTPPSAKAPTAERPATAAAPKPAAPKPAAPKPVAPTAVAPAAPVAAQPPPSNNDDNPY